jgi:hypothetical protein
MHHALFNRGGEIGVSPAGGGNAGFVCGKYFSGDSSLLCGFLEPTARTTLGLKPTIYVRFNAALEGPLFHGVTGVPGEDRGLKWDVPTQAKGRLEWATDGVLS